jgi:hypothetical protein
MHERLPSKFSIESAETAAIPRGSASFNLRHTKVAQSAAKLTFENLAQGGARGLPQLRAARRRQTRACCAAVR